MTLQSKMLPLLLITSTLLLGGCSKNVEKNAADAQVQDSVPDGDESTASNEPELAKADYWKPLAPLLAGTYSASCTNPAGEQRAEATLLIDAGGKYKFQEFSGDLHATKHAMFGRKQNGDGTAALTFNALWDDADLGLRTDDTGQNYTASFSKGQAKQFVCSPAKGTLALAGKPFFSVFASVLETPLRTINCVRAANMAITPLPYTFKAGVLNIGEYKFELAHMDEMVTIDNGFSGLLYMATSADERSIGVGLDEHGKVMMVTVGSKEGPLLSCSKD